MAVTKTIIKLSNTEAVIRISGIAGDTATIILDSDLLLPLEYLNNDPIKVNIGAVYCTGVSGGYASIIRNSVTIMDVACKSLNPINMMGEPFVPDSINNTSNIVVNISGQPAQVYIYLKKVSGFTSTDTVIASAFNVLSLFGAGEQGAWYDPSDLTTLFQDSAGTTPMSAVGTVADQPVGLMLDKSKGLALGAELVTNGDFSNGSTGWATDPSWTIVSGAANFAYTTALRLIQDFAGVTGKYCIISVDIKSTNASGLLYFYVGGNAYLVDTSTTGIKTFMAVWGGTRLTIQPQNTTWVGSIDNISVKQIAGNHAFQATAGNRPVLSARVNLLTKTEDFSDAVWGDMSTGVTTKTSGFSAPDGLLTAYKLIGNNANTWFGQSVGSGQASTTKTVSLYLRTDTTATPSLKYVFGGGLTYSKSISLTSSWALFTFEQTFLSSDTQSVSFAINIGSGVNVYIWHPDLRPTNAGALLPPYQRVNTASDYDTVGFPLYLKANGTSSAMSTNSIDFTATDKMTVVTGVRKLSDAADANVVSLGSSPQNGVGTFEVSAPNSYGAVSNNNFSWLLAQTQTTITRASLYATPFVAPIASVLSCNYNFGGATLANQILPRVNGSIPTLAASTLGTYAGAGNFSNNPIYFFSRGGTAMFLNGNFYGAIIRGAQSDQTSVIKAEKLIATKTGITF